MSTTADLLRRAAALVRERASDATAGPWRLSLADWAENCVDYVENTAGDAVLDTEHGAILPSDADADWIALVGPQLAEPLAGWLDQAADDADMVERINTRADERRQRETAAGYTGPDGHTRVAPHDLVSGAVRVARALLGEPEGAGR